LTEAELLNHETILIKVSAEIDAESYESIKEWLPLIWNQVKSCSQMHYDKINRKLLDATPSSSANSVSISPTEAVMLHSQIPESQSIPSISDLDTERYMKIISSQNFYHFILLTKVLKR